MWPTRKPAAAGLLAGRLVPATCWLLARPHRCPCVPAARLTPQAGYIEAGSLSDFDSTDEDGNRVEHVHNGVRVSAGGVPRPACCWPRRLPGPAALLAASRSRLPAVPDMLPCMSTGCPQPQWCLRWPWPCSQVVNHMADSWNDEAAGGQGLHAGQLAGTRGAASATALSACACILCLLGARPLAAAKHAGLQQQWPAPCGPALILSEADATAGDLPHGFIELLPGGTP